MDVPWKHRCFLDVGKANDLLGQAFEPQAETAVGRQAVLVGEGKKGKILGIHPAALDLGDQLLVFMDALAPRGDLQPAKK